MNPARPVIKKHITAPALRGGSSLVRIWLDARMCVLELRKRGFCCTFARCATSASRCSSNGVDENTVHHDVAVESQ